MKIFSYFASPLLSAESQLIMPISYATKKRQQFLMGRKKTYTHKAIGRAPCFLCYL